MSGSNLPTVIPSKKVWSHGRIVGQNQQLLPMHVWAFGVQLELAGATRNLALFNMAVDSKFRGCDLVRLKVADVYAAGTVKERASILQS
ncbi:MAG: integrase [Pseudomonadota bacterium]